jgi:hypothetical protein
MIGEDARLPALPVLAVRRPRYVVHDRGVIDTTSETATEHGDRGVAMAGEILRTVVGSGVHGIAIDGTDDHDEMGVYVEPPQCVVGLYRPATHYVWRSQPEGARSGPGDTDLVMYSLRRYLRLATVGNPTVLLPLYAPAEAVLVCRPLGQQLRDLAPAVLSQQAVHRFLGYMNGQRDRLLGRGWRGRVPNRPELVARYGYDVKYASHALRLAYQGLEIVRDGRLTLPMPEPEREQVLRVKRGEVGDLTTCCPRSTRSRRRCRNIWTAAVPRCRSARTWQRSRRGLLTPTASSGAGPKPHCRPVQTPGPPPRSPAVIFADRLALRTNPSPGTWTATAECDI